MTTKTKIFLASLAYRGVAVVRRATGRGSVATVVRGGVCWKLDLAEGIDFSIYLLRGFERSTGNVLDKLVHRGDTVFDIGANIGAHTLPLARRVGAEGQVFAFEPSSFAFDKLTTNVSLNPGLQERIHLSQTMLTDDVNALIKENIYASWPLREDSSLHPKHRGRLTTTAGARPDTLDSFIDQHPISRLQLIKIDVDGNEYPVLHGGLRTLEQFRPFLLMEFAPYVHREMGNSFAALLDLLRYSGYRLEEVGTGRRLSYDVNEFERIIPDGSGINVLGYPQERRP